MVTLTGTFTRLDGTPATGTVRVTPSRSPIMDPDGKIVISGPQVFPLDKDGKLSVPIPASNDPDLGPPFTYAIDVNLTHASWKISKVWIPHGSTTVDLSEIADYTPTPGVATRVVTIPADGTDGQVLVWDGAGFSWMDAPAGPQGPPGEVTTAALTTALAGKVTGTGMTLRHDNTVGERVFLDHPGGSTLLSGWSGVRDITNLLQNGATADQVRFFWNANSATIAFNQLNMDESPSGMVAILSGSHFPSPHGAGGTRLNIPIASNAGASFLQISGGGAIYMARGNSALNTAQFTSGSWTINPSTWPSTLPGTPL